MDKIGKVSWQRFEKFLFAVGCEFKSEEGDHRKYKKAGLLRPVIIPREKYLPQFIILNNLRTLGVTKEEFARIMKEL